MIPILLHPAMTLQQLSAWCAAHQMILTVDFRWIRGELVPVTYAEAASAEDCAARLVSRG
jgi:hypothetical protein